MKSIYIDNAFSICYLYSTLTYIVDKSISNDILVGFSCVPKIIERLWKFINGIKLETFINTMDFTKDMSDDELQQTRSLAGIVTLFCFVARIYIGVANDQTLYSTQTPMPADQALSPTSIAASSVFFNKLVFSCLYKVCFDEKTGNYLKQPNRIDSLFQTWLDTWSDYLILIYDKDRKKSFIPFEMPKKEVSGFSKFLPINHKYKKAVLLEKRWTMPEYTKFSHHYKEEQYSQVLQRYLPWIYPFDIRVRCFRDQVDKDKQKFEKKYISININRNSIIEDAFSQLMPMNQNHIYRWRSCFKVSFINEHGLSEAGIDQNGVFKEFMETLMTKLFSADFGLFKWTGVEESNETENEISERCCFPSNLSYLHENHLELFKFAGQMMAKALYEGLVLDIPLAVFFLRHLLPKAGTTTDLYSIV